MQNIKVKEYTYNIPNKPRKFMLSLRNLTNESIHYKITGNVFSKKSKKKEKKISKTNLRASTLIRKSLYTVNKINFMEKKFKCYYPQKNEIVYIFRVPEPFYRISTKNHDLKF